MKLRWYLSDRGERRTRCGRYVVWLGGKARHGPRWENEWSASRAETQAGGDGGGAVWLCQLAGTVAEAKAVCQADADEREDG